MLDASQMTAALTHMSARMDAIEAWAATVSETVSTNASTTDQQIMEMIESLGDKASMAAMQEVDGKIMNGPWKGGQENNMLLMSLANGIMKPTRNSWPSFLN